MAKEKKEIDEFKRIVDEMVDLKSRKSGDYANSWKVLGLQGLNYQVMRKVTRIWINRNKKDNLNFEMIRDSYMDLAVYALMCIQLLDSGNTEDEFDKILKQ